jgi:hypothetical protein
MAHFTDDQVDALERRFEVRRPAVPETSDSAKFENVESFAEAPTEIGLHLRMRMTDGTERLLLLNPVVARRLALSVLYRGEEAGWLDAYGDVITSPTIPKAPT